MKTDVRLSTKFLTAQGGHQVGVLVTLAGDLGGAAEALEQVSATLSPYRAEPGVAEEMQDLSDSAQRLMACEYGPLDRKYHGARAMAIRDEKAAYLRKMSRRRPDPKP